MCVLGAAERLESSLNESIGNTTHRIILDFEEHLINI